MPRLPQVGSLVLVPVSAALAFPLLPFAMLTTALAVVCLVLRAVFIYAELAGSLLKQLVRPDPPVALALAEYSLKSQPLYSFSSSGSLTPRRPSTPYASYGAPPPPPIGTASSGGGASATAAGGAGVGTLGHSRGNSHGSSHSMYMLGTGGGSSNGGLSTTDRDYEGVGGWRDVDAQEDAQWIGLNSRLELPALAGSVGGSSNGRPTHRRSFTGGSVRLSLDRGPSALSLRNAAGGGVSGRARAETAGGMLSGTVSPDEGGLTMKTRSMVDIAMNVGRARGSGERRKSGSSGSGSSGNSHGTMTGTTGQGWMAP